MFSLFFRASHSRERSGLPLALILHASCATFNKEWGWNLSEPHPDWQAWWPCWVSFGKSILCLILVWKNLSCEYTISGLNKMQAAKDNWWITELWHLCFLETHNYCINLYLYYYYTNSSNLRLLGYSPPLWTDPAFELVKRTKNCFFWMCW